MKEDSGRGWRRVVASPKPLEILELECDPRARRDRRVGLRGRRRRHPGRRAGKPPRRDRRRDRQGSGVGAPRHRARRGEAPHRHAGRRRLPRLRHRRGGAIRDALAPARTTRSSTTSPPARCGRRSRRRSTSCGKPAARSRSRAPRRSPKAERAPASFRKIVATVIPVQLKGRDFLRVNDWDERGHRHRPRPRRPPQGAPEAGDLRQAPREPDARDDLLEAVHADARQLRDRHLAARRHRALPERERPAARARRDDQGHGDRALPLRRRDHDPHVQAVGRGRAGEAFVDPGDQRADGRLPPVPGARRRDDDPRALRRADRRARRLPRRRQQRLPLADGRVREAGRELRRRGSRGLRAERRGRRAGPARPRIRGTRPSRSSTTRSRAPPEPTSSTPTSGRAWARTTSARSASPT